jgi:hypothetical protein
MDGYDIIGDVHGCADKLEGLLIKLGYEKSDGVYQHPERKAIFVGDLIDRGHQQVETIQIVRPMVETDAALIVMGNHEFNAVSFATRNPEIPGEFMRRHTEKNWKQHQAFIEQVQIHPGLYTECIEWFKTMPLYLDLENLRVVHACWSDISISTVEQWVQPGIPMPKEFVVKANQQGTHEYQAVETLLKGPEMSLKKYGQQKFVDKDGHPRHEARIRWWNASGTTLRDLAEIPGDARTPDGAPYPVLPQTPCPDESVYDYKDEKTVFYGHYWRYWPATRDQDWTNDTVCVDFSAVKGGPLVAYQWDCGADVSENKYVHFPVD